MSRSQLIAYEPCLGSGSTSLGDTLSPSPPEERSQREQQNGAANHSSDDSADIRLVVWLCSL